MLKFGQEVVHSCSDGCTRLHVLPTVTLVRAAQISALLLVFACLVQDWSRIGDVLPGISGTPSPCYLAC